MALVSGSGTGVAVKLYSRLFCGLDRMLEKVRPPAISVRLAPRAPTAHPRDAKSVNRPAARTSRGRPQHRRLSAQARSRSGDK